MKSWNYFLLRFVIILISVVLVDGGKFFLMVAKYPHYFIDQKHSNDLEIPNHESFSKLADIEKWVDQKNNEQIGTDNSYTLNSYTQNLNPRDYSKTVWQPPKSV